jgi:hypothetical protein
MQVKKSKASQVLWSITLGALLMGSIQGIGKVYAVVKKATGGKSYQLARGKGGGGDTGGFRSDTEVSKS